MADENFKIFFLFSILNCIIFVASNSNNDSRSLRVVAPTNGAPWPHPKVLTASNIVQDVDSKNFSFSIESFTCEIIEDAVKRYSEIIFPHNTDTLYFEPRATGLSKLSILLTKQCENIPYLGMDEAYSLTVSPGSGVLKSNSVWGILRGLETFSQLIYNNGNKLQINNTNINDAPRFSHRGFLLDTSRHFLSVEILLKNLEAMAMNKLNVFHWHIVDDQSFPYDSKTFPELSSKGAYTPKQVYSQADVAKVIEFARVRGIRVLPEFDTPGHSRSMGNSHPEILTKCYSGGKFNGNYGPIDPTKNTTFTFLTSLFKEVATVFPDRYIHLGGDEVDFTCWKSNPDVTAFMKQKGFGTNYAKLEEYYMQKILDLVTADKKGYVIWQEVLDNGCKVKPDTVAHVWKGGYKAELAKVTKLGLRTLLSSCWYLNYISYGPDWSKYYSCDPQDFEGTAEQKALIIGGEACMWGEFVDNTNVLSRSWPRVSVVAERLWSPATLKDANKAEPRLVEQRCRMIRRGFPAEPISGPGFCKEE